MNTALLTLLGITIVSELAADAALIYGNLTNGTSEADAYGVYWSYSAAPSFPLGSAVGAQFSVPFGTDYRLSSVAVAVSQQNPAVNLTISVHSDLGSQPGAVLETIVIDPPAFGNSVRPGPTTFVSALAPVLSGGNSYWLVLEPRSLALTSSSQNSFYTWHANYEYAQGGLATRNADPITGEWGAWNAYNNILPAFNIEGTAVPEPSTWALLTLGSALFWWAARRRRI